MKQLTEEQFELCQEYLAMISCIEEGFEYVKASFTDFSKTEGDLILSDILEALAMIASTNTILERLFATDESILKTITSFQNVIDAAFKLEEHFEQYDTKVKNINDYLYPTFSTWKSTIQNAVSGFIAQ